MGREWSARRICTDRPPGCLSRVELQACILDSCLYLSVYCYEGAHHDAGTVYHDISCRGPYRFSRDVDFFKEYRSPKTIWRALLCMYSWGEGMPPMKKSPRRIKGCPARRTLIRGLSLIKTAN